MSQFTQLIFWVCLHIRLEKCVAYFWKMKIRWETTRCLYAVVLFCLWIILIFLFFLFPFFHDKTERRPLHIIVTLLVTIISQKSDSLTSKAPSSDTNSHDSCEAVPPTAYGSRKRDNSGLSILSDILSGKRTVNPRQLVRNESHPRLLLGATSSNKFSWVKEEASKSAANFEPSSKRRRVLEGIIAARSVAGLLSRGMRIYSLQIAVFFKYRI